MWKYTLIVCIALLHLALAAHVNPTPKIKLPLKKLKSSADRIKSHGYPAESHFVETEDGYVLNIFRIPYSPKLNNEHEQKPVVLIQHGFMSCSDCFLLNGPDNALAYNFADAGFDVWLANSRGNIYSRNNTKLSANHPYFWDFTWHELGAIDIAAMIDYMLEKTGEPSLHYVGHSQGGTVFFVLTSWRPEYNAKIKSAHLLAPVVFMGNATVDLITELAKYLGEPGKATNLLESQELLPNNPLIQRVLDTACSGTPTFPEYCHTLVLMMAGTDLPNTNKTLLPQIAETHPAGVSSSQGIHFLQSYNNGGFKRYDRGVKKNLKYYNQEEPAEYPLDKITTEVCIYYSLADTSANKKDLLRLQPLLSNLKVFHEVPEPTWAHFDFVFAQEVKQVVNDPVIQYCENYEQQNRAK